MTAPILTATPSLAIDPVSARIAALEARVAALEAVLMIRSDGTATVKVPGKLTLDAASLDVKTTGDVYLRAGANVTFQASSNATFRAVATMNIEASATMTLRSSIINLN
jgi:hypothetical protein